MDKVEHNEDAEEISIMDKIFILVTIALSFAIPVFLVLDILDIRPEGETVGEWAQRSGAIMVIFAVYVEAANKRLLRKSSDFKNSKTYKIVSFFYPPLVIAGTFIWGYLDLF